MTHRLTTDCGKNYCIQTLIVKVIVENVVTCFFYGTQCSGNDCNDFPDNQLAKFRTVETIKAFHDFYDKLT